MKKDKILPQANSLSTVIKVFIYASVMEGCSISEIADFCGFEPRQASYYLNACVYLDLVDYEGNVTDFGNSIIENYETPHNAIYERIITDEVIGKIFSHILLFPKDDIMDFSIKLLTPLYPEYAEAVIRRRASTLKSWSEDIIKTLNS